MFHAISIGGTGIWTMHFTAMLGMGMGAPIAYDIPITLLSMVVAVVVVGAGPFAVDIGAARPAPLLLGGLFTGLGVAGMPYTSMAAVEFSGSVHYDLSLVGVSIVIAVVAATAALWATTTIRGPIAITGASLVMGLAVTGMHYTGMAAMHVQLDRSARVLVSNTSALVTSVIIGVAAVSVITVFMVALMPTTRELDEEAELLERIMSEPPDRSVRESGSCGMRAERRCGRHRHASHETSGWSGRFPDRTERTSRRDLPSRSPDPV